MMQIGVAKISTIKVALAALGVLSSTVLCKAEDTCPWITTATVINAPDPSVSDVQTAVTNNGNSCVFHYRKADSLYSVQIAIRVTSDAAPSIAHDAAQCKSDKTDLPAIANEVILCSTSAHAERLVGRVRDQIFTINVDVKTKQSSADLTKSLSDMATMMAKQVAGNLF